MTAQRILDSINKAQKRTSPLPEFRAGDSVKVWAKIREGDKTRLQAFEGVCIRRTTRGTRSTFTVRKMSYGVGVERIFPDNSPNIERVEILQRGKVRQSRLFYLRDLQGKAARIKEREGHEAPANTGEIVDTLPTGGDKAAAGEKADKGEKVKDKGRGKRQRKKNAAAAVAAE